MFASRIHASSLFSLVTTPSFALTVFRIEPSLSPTAPACDLNDLNKEFYTRLSQRTDILLTQTELNGVFCMRFAVGARATEEGDVLWAWEVIKEVGEAVYHEWSTQQQRI